MGELAHREYFDPVSNIHEVLGQVSGGAAVARHRLDLNYIGDPDDREFLRLVIDTLLAIEPGNTDLVVLKNTDYPIWIVWVQGLRRPVGDPQRDVLKNLPHPVRQHRGIGSVKVYPPKGMQPMRLVCEVNPYAPTRAREEQRRRLESNHRYRDRDRSPVRHSSPPVRYSPPPVEHRRSSRRSTRRSPVHSSSSDPSSSDSEEGGPSLMSRLNPFSKGTPSRQRRRRRN